MKICISECKSEMLILNLFLIYVFIVSLEMLEFVFFYFTLVWDNDKNVVVQIDFNILISEVCVG